jgi:hypothetical protein
LDPAKSPGGEAGATDFLVMMPLVSRIYFWGISSVMKKGESAAKALIMVVAVPVVLAAVIVGAIVLTGVVRTAHDMLFNKPPTSFPRHVGGHPSHDDDEPPPPIIIERRPPYAPKPPR